MYPTYFHLAAYLGTLTNGAVLAQVPALVDQVLTKTTSNNYVSPKPVKLLGWYAAGANISDAQISTPSLRYVGLPFLGQLNSALVVPSPANLGWFGDIGVRIPEVDEIQVAHSLGGAAPEVEFSLLWLQVTGKPQTPGPTYRLKFTATINAVSGVWTAGSMTPVTTLPAGKYDVNNMIVIGTNLAAARLIFPGSFWRPGVLAMNAAGSVIPSPMIDGSLGCFGTFKSINLPNLEVLATGANSAQTVFLEVVRVDDYQP